MFTQESIFHLNELLSMMILFHSKKPTKVPVELAVISNFFYQTDERQAYLIKILYFPKTFFDTEV